ncbi:MAG: hypothetical protein IJ733_16560 [Lachnospiraceae bacterium]|nr:hypothetical protein [Lachnospiraceae bacterium]
MEKETEFPRAGRTIPYAMVNTTAKTMRKAPQGPKHGMPVGRGNVMGSKRHRKKSALTRKKTGVNARSGLALGAGLAMRSNGAARPGVVVRTSEAKPGEVVITDSKGRAIQSIAVNADAVHVNVVHADAIHANAVVGAASADVMVKGSAAEKLGTVFHAGLAGKANTAVKGKISFAGSIVSPSDFHM